jgi:hypothetical protein
VTDNLGISGEIRPCGCVVQLSHDSRRVHDLLILPSPALEILRNPPLDVVEDLASPAVNPTKARPVLVPALVKQRQQSMDERRMLASRAANRVANTNDSWRDLPTGKVDLHSRRSLEALCRTWLRSPSRGESSSAGAKAPCVCVRGTVLSCPDGRPRIETPFRPSPSALSPDRTVDAPRSCRSTRKRAARECRAA